MPAASRRASEVFVPAVRGAPADVALEAKRGPTSDAQFVELLNSYRRSGGLARAAEVGAALGQHSAGDVAVLARWIVGGAVIHFDWQAETWMPLFQFGGPGGVPHVAVGRVIGELSAVMPALALAQWFARPNAALGGQRPADALLLEADAVWQAARADRYLIDA